MNQRWKLFVMMVLQFAIWGAWLPLIFGYLPSLGFDDWQQSAILNAFPIAAIVGMFFGNQFADRNFAAEKFLAVSHLIGGASMLGLGFVHDFWSFCVLMYVHCLCYVPTISITNAIAFAHLSDSQREFGFVRMGGTIGWILVAWPFTFVFVDWDAVRAVNPEGVVAWLGEALKHPLAKDALRAATTWTFVVAGGASLLLSAFALTLPHTPPRASESLAWAKAFRLLKHPFVLVLWVVALVDALVHQSFFMWTGRFLESAQVGIPGNWVMPVMSISQVAEIVTMVVGVLGHVLRFFVFAHLPDQPSLIVAINVVHGICYAFFFATVYIFVDTFLPKDIRSSAQGLFNLMILGVGPLLANTLGPHVFTHYTSGAVPDWLHLFELPMWFALGAAILLAFAFEPPPEPARS